MNNPVNSKLTILLKNKGFDEVTAYIYSEVYGLIENINGLKHSDGDNRFVSIPTIAEVVIWLYEKHGIWIYVNEDFRPHIYKNGENLIYQGQLFYTIENSKKYCWDDPIQAYESAIEYVLRNLLKTI